MIVKGSRSWEILIVEEKVIQSSDKREIKTHKDLRGVNSYKNLQKFISCTCARI